MTIKTITDLARLAGVSPGTVSRALSGRGQLSQQTRARIRALPDEHGLQLNRTAQTLKMGRSNAISVVLLAADSQDSGLGEPTATLLGHLTGALAAEGQDLILSRLVPDGEGDWLQPIVRSGRSDGAIILGQGKQHPLLHAVGQSYLPLMVWGQEQPEQSYGLVGPDNRRGGYLATAHLIASGRRRIAFAGERDGPICVACHAGYADALREAGLAPAAYISTGTNVRTAFDAVRAACAAGEPFDALVTVSDLVALGAIRALRESGRRVPEDVAVIGHGDIGLADFVQPRLTTVRHDLEAAAQLLVEGLLGRIAGEPGHPRTIEPELVIRESA